MRPFRALRSGRPVDLLRERPEGLFYWHKKPVKSFFLAIIKIH
jgi:hypothetical protein